MWGYGKQFAKCNKSEKTPNCSANAFWMDCLTCQRLAACFAKFDLEAKCGNQCHQWWWNYSKTPWSGSIPKKSAIISIEIIWASDRQGSKPRWRNFYLTTNCNISSTKQYTVMIKSSMDTADFFCNLPAWKTKLPELAMSFKPPQKLRMAL